MTCLKLHLHYENGVKETKELNLPVLIGRAKDAGLILNSWRIAKQHARLVLKQSELWLEDLGSLTGTLVNGKRVSIYGPLQASDEIIIGNCLIAVQLLNNVIDSTNITDYQLQPSGNDNLTNVLNEPNANLATNKDTTVQSTPPSDTIYLNHRKRLHQELITALQLKRSNINEMSDSTLRFEANKTLLTIIEQDKYLPTDVDKNMLRQQLLDEAVGLGPLEDLLRDPMITEIMVNSHNEIFVEKAGQLEPTEYSFSSEQAVMGVIERIVSPLGRRIDDSSPMVDARLKDGSRVNAIISPIALRGASLTIRKFPQQRLVMQDLIRVGALDQNMALFLNACVQQKKNILISGGTGSGKTSLLNILSNAIASNERIITIEDAAELKLNHSHQVNLESRPANVEGKGLISIRDLVKNALRMRPDRIVVGECRGAEAFDTLSAMNTGHEGSLTTLHANSPRDALARLETMVLMAGMDIPLAAIREHIAAAVDIIVQLQRCTSGQRLITTIVQVTGIESGRIQLQELFQTSLGPPTVFQGCGLLPEGFITNDAININLFSHSTSAVGAKVL